ncbi:MAG TPA: hypothetical protein VG937_23755 [Polyangiaceae bacterium]|nr:hypothetical protein [Polyangiaceae bacterium]
MEATARTRAGPLENGAAAALGNTGGKAARAETRAGNETTGGDGTNGGDGSADGGDAGGDHGGTPGTGGVGGETGGATGGVSGATGGVGGAASGGTSGGSSSGAGGTGGSGPLACTLVATQDFEKAANDGTWLVDNSAAQSGQASHPPSVAAGSTASMTYSCAGKAHSLLTFFYRGANPTADQRLNFYVDNALYATYGSTSNGVGGYSFNEVTLALPDGKHQYRWEATTSSTAQPPYWVDSITCTEGGGAAAEPHGSIGFEECFVPSETTGAWQVDNSSRQAGKLAIHPPVLTDGDTASLSYSCGGEVHSELSFYYQGINPTAGQTLKFFVDDKLYQTYGSTPNGVGGYYFPQVALTVPSGQHAYRWDVTSNVAGRPPYFIDSIVCKNTAIAPITNGDFGLEAGFVPQELTGTWEIDNSSKQAGTYAIHPPVLAAGDTASLNFSCGGKPHSKMGFYYQGINATAGQTLKFYVDNKLYQTYGATPNGVGGFYFPQVALTVPTGMHSYRWDVTTNVAGRPPYFLDLITCENVPITTITNGDFGLEAGFVPKELGGPWEIDNSSKQAGTYAIHPPVLGAGDTASLSFSCGDQVHSKIGFYYQGINPTSGQTLKFFVDDKLYETYGSTPNGVGGYYYPQVALTVPTGKHTYRWDVTTNIAGRPPYFIDSITCENVPVTAITNGDFGLETGFVPQELTGTWQIDNSSKQAGTYGIHPAILAAGDTASLSFACGDLTHSQIGFYYQGVNPTAGQTLKFYVDDALYQTYGSTPNGVGGYYYPQVALTVPTGKHTYRWDVTTNVVGRPPYFIDSITCSNVSTTANTTGLFGFEEGFVPAEISGTWQIDNSSKQAGTFGAHPGILGASQTASLGFSCGSKTHSQRSFYYQGVNPSAGQTLKFYVDGALYQTYGSTPNGVGGYYFPKVSVTSASGMHSYRWDATTDVAAQPPYWIDTVQCQ